MNRDQDDSYDPGKQPYAGVKEGAAGKGMQNLRQILADEKRQKSSYQRRNEKIDERLQRSLTRKLIDGLFFFGYLFIGLHLLLSLIGQAGLLTPVWFIRHAYVFPVSLLWNPDPQVWLLAGQFEINKLDVITLIVYAPLHVILRMVHVAVTADRIYSPD